MEGEGMVAVVRGLRNDGLAITLLDGSRQYTLMPNNYNGGSPPVPQIAPKQCSPTASTNTATQPVVSAKNTTDCSTGPSLPVCENGAQAIDGRYASMYKTMFCNVNPTSPPEQLTEFPPQRPDLSRGHGNFQVGGTGSGARYSPIKVTTPNYRGGLIWPDRGAVFTPRPSYETDAFANSLRKYPNNLSPNRSSEVMERIINYTHAKGTSKTSTRNQGSPTRLSDPASHHTLDSRARNGRYEPEIIIKTKKPLEEPTRDYKKEDSRDAPRTLRTSRGYEVRCAKDTTKRIRDTVKATSVTPHSQTQAIGSSTANRDKHDSHHHHVAHTSSVNMEIQAAVKMLSKEVATVHKESPPRKNVAVPDANAGERKSEGEFYIVPNLAKTVSHKSVQTTFSHSNTTLTLRPKKSAQTVYSSIEFYTKRKRDNSVDRKSKSQEEIKVAKGELQRSLLQLIEEVSTSSKPKETIRDELLKKLFNTDNGDRKESKDEKENNINRDRCHKYVSTFCPSSCDYVADYFELVSELKRCYGDSKQNSRTDIKPLKVSEYKQLDFVLKDWINDLNIQPTYKDGEPIDRNEILKSIEEEIKGLFKYRTKEELDYRLEIVKIIENIPIEINSSYNKKSYLHRLVDILLKRMKNVIISQRIDRNRRAPVHRSRRILTEEDIRYFLKGHLFDFYEKHHLEISDKEMHDLENELIDILVDSIDCIRSGHFDDAREEMEIVLQEFGKLKKSQSDDIRDILLLDFREILNDCNFNQTFMVLHSGVAKNYTNSFYNIELSSEDIGEEDINDNIDYYTNELCIKINEWLDSLDLPEIHDRGFKHVVINDLAVDIVDRVKYLDLNINMTDHEKDELETLKYQIFKWINKLVGEENTETISHAQELMDKIKSLNIPKLSVTHNQEICAYNVGILSRLYSLMSRSGTNVKEECSCAPGVCEKFAAENKDTLLDSISEPGAAAKDKVCCSQSGCINAPQKTEGKQAGEAVIDEPCCPPGVCEEVAGDGKDAPFDPWKPCLNEPGATCKNRRVCCGKPACINTPKAIKVEQPSGEKSEGKQADEAINEGTDNADEKEEPCCPPGVCDEFAIERDAPFNPWKPCLNETGVTCKNRRVCCGKPACVNTPKPAIIVTTTAQMDSASQTPESQQTQAGISHLNQPRDRPTDSQPTQTDSSPVPIHQPFPGKHFLPTVGGPDVTVHPGSGDLNQGYPERQAQPAHPNIPEHPDFIYDQESPALPSQGQGFDSNVPDGMPRSEGPGFGSAPSQDGKNVSSSLPHGSDKPQPPTQYAETFQGVPGGFIPGNADINVGPEHATYDKSSSPLQEQNFDRGQTTLPSAYDKSSSPLQEQNFDRGQTALPPGYDKSSSPLQEQNFDRGQTALPPGYDKSSSPLQEQNFDREQTALPPGYNKSSSPLQEQNFDREQTPLPPGYDKSSSPLQEQNFDRGQTALPPGYVKSSSPLQEQRFDRGQTALPPRDDNLKSRTTTSPDGPQDPQVQESYDRIILRTPDGISQKEYQIVSPQQLRNNQTVPDISGPQNKSTGRTSATYDQERSTRPADQHPDRQQPTGTTNQGFVEGSVPQSTHQGLHPASMPHGEDRRNLSMPTDKGFAVDSIRQPQGDSSRHGSDPYSQDQGLVEGSVPQSDKKGLRPASIPHGKDMRNLSMPTDKGFAADSIRQPQGDSSEHGSDPYGRDKGFIEGSVPQPEKQGLRPASIPHGEDRRNLSMPTDKGFAADSIRQPQGDSSGHGSDPYGQDQGVVEGSVPQSEKQGLRPASIPHGEDRRNLSMPTDKGFAADSIRQPQGDSSGHGSDPYGRDKGFVEGSVPQSEKQGLGPASIPPGEDKRNLSMPTDKGYAADSIRQPQGDTSGHGSDPHGRDQGYVEGFVPQSEKQGLHPASIPHGGDRQNLSMPTDKDFAVDSIQQPQGESSGHDPYDQDHGFVEGSVPQTGYHGLRLASFPHGEDRRNLSMPTDKGFAADSLQKPQGEGLGSSTDPYGQDRGQFSRPADQSYKKDSVSQPQGDSLNYDSVPKGQYKRQWQKPGADKYSQPQTKPTDQGFQNQGIPPTSAPYSEYKDHSFMPTDQKRVEDSAVLPQGQSLRPSASQGQDRRQWQKPIDQDFHIDEGLHPVPYGKDWQQTTSSVPTSQDQSQDREQAKKPTGQGFPGGLGTVSQPQDQSLRGPSAPYVQDKRQPTAPTEQSFQRSPQEHALQDHGLRPQDIKVPSKKGLGYQDIPDNFKGKTLPDCCKDGTADCCQQKGNVKQGLKSLIGDSKPEPQDQGLPPTSVPNGQNRRQFTRPIDQGLREFMEGRPDSAPYGQDRQQWNRPRSQSYSDEKDRGFRAPSSTPYDRDRWQTSRPDRGFLEDSNRRPRDDSLRSVSEPYGRERRHPTIDQGFSQDSFRQPQPDSRRAFDPYYQDRRDTTRPINQDHVWDTTPRPPNQNLRPSVSYGHDRRQWQKPIDQNFRNVEYSLPQPPNQNLNRPSVPIDQGRQQPIGPIRQDYIPQHRDERLHDATGPYGQDWRHSTKPNEQSFQDRAHRYVPEPHDQGFPHTSAAYDQDTRQPTRYTNQGFLDSTPQPQGDSLRHAPASYSEDKRQHMRPPEYVGDTASQSQGQGYGSSAPYAQDKRQWQKPEGQGFLDLKDSSYLPQDVGMRPIYSEDWRKSTRPTAQGFIEGAVPQYQDQDLRTPASYHRDWQQGKKSTTQGFPIEESALSQPQHHSPGWTSAPYDHDRRQPTAPTVQGFQTSPQDYVPQVQGVYPTTQESLPDCCKDGTADCCLMGNSIPEPQNQNLHPASDPYAQNRLQFTKPNEQGLQNFVDNRPNSVSYGRDRQQWNIPTGQDFADVKDSVSKPQDRATAAPFDQDRRQPSRPDRELREQRLRPAIETYGQDRRQPTQDQGLRPSVSYGQERRLWQKPDVRGFSDPQPTTPTNQGLSPSASYGQDRRHWKKPYGYGLPGQEGSLSQPPDLSFGQASVKYDQDTSQATAPNEPGFQSNAQYYVPQDQSSRPISEESKALEKEGETYQEGSDNDEPVPPYNRKKRVTISIGEDAGPAEKSLYGRRENSVPQNQDTGLWPTFSTHNQDRRQWKKPIDQDFSNLEGSLPHPQDQSLDQAPISSDKSRHQPNMPVDQGFQGITQNVIPHDEGSRPIEESKESGKELPGYQKELDNEQNLPPCCRMRRVSIASDQYTQGDGSFNSAPVGNNEGQPQKKGSTTKVNAVKAKDSTGDSSSKDDSLILFEGSFGSIAGDKSQKTKESVAKRFTDSTAQYDQKQGRDSFIKTRQIIVGPSDQNLQNDSFLRLKDLGSIPNLLDMSRFRPKYGRPIGQGTLSDSEQEQKRKAKRIAKVRSDEDFDLDDYDIILEYKDSSYTPSFKYKGQDRLRTKGPVAQGVLSDSDYRQQVQALDVSGDIQTLDLASKGSEDRKLMEGPTGKSFQDSAENKTQIEDPVPKYEARIQTDQQPSISQGVQNTPGDTFRQDEDQNWRPTSMTRGPPRRQWKEPTGQDFQLDSGDMIPQDKKVSGPFSEPFDQPRQQWKDANDHYIQGTEDKDGFQPSDVNRSIGTMSQFPDPNKQTNQFVIFPPMRSYAPGDTAGNISQMAGDRNISPKANYDAGSTQRVIDQLTSDTLPGQKILSPLSSPQAVYMAGPKMTAKVPQGARSSPNDTCCNTAGTCCPDLTSSSKAVNAGSPQSLKQLNDKYDEYLKQWVQQIPMEANTPEEQEAAEKARLGIYNGLWKIFTKCKLDDKTFSDPLNFQDVFSEEVEELLDQLPKTPEYERQKQELKAQLLKETKKMNEAIKSSQAPSSFKKQLLDIIENNMPTKPKNINVDAPDLQDEMVKKMKVADDYILYLRYKNEDSEKANMHKTNYLNSITDYIKKVKANCCKTVNVASKANDIKIALEKVPLPSMDYIRDEADDILIGNEVGNWISDLPQRPDDSFGPLEKRRMRDAIVMKIKELSTTADIGDCSFARPLKNELPKYLEKVPLQEGTDVDFMIDELANRLKKIAPELGQITNGTLDDTDEYEMFSRNVPGHSSKVNIPRDETEWHSLQETKLPLPGHSNMVGRPRDETEWRSLQETPFPLPRHSSMVGRPRSEAEWRSLQETQSPHPGHPNMVGRPRDETEWRSLQETQLPPNLANSLCCHRKECLNRKKLLDQAKSITPDSSRAASFRGSPLPFGSSTVPLGRTTQGPFDDTFPQGQRAPMLFGPIQSFGPPGVNIRQPCCIPGRPGFSPIGPGQTISQNVPQGAYGQQHGMSGQTPHSMYGISLNDTPDTSYSPTSRGVYSQSPQGNVGQVPQSHFGQGPQAGFGQRPLGSFSQGPQAGFNQGPQAGFGQRPLGDFSQGPQAGFGQMPQAGFDQGPQASFGQGPQAGVGEGPLGGFVYGPQAGFGQRPLGGFSQGPQAGFGQGPQASFGQGPQGGYGQGPKGAFAQVPRGPCQFPQGAPGQMPQGVCGPCQPGGPGQVPQGGLPPIRGSPGWTASSMSSYPGGPPGTNIDMSVSRPGSKPFPQIPGSGLHKPIINSKPVGPGVQICHRPTCVPQPLGEDESDYYRSTDSEGIQRVIDQKKSVQGTTSGSTDSPPCTYKMRLVCPPCPPRRQRVCVGKQKKRYESSDNKGSDSDSDSDPDKDRILCRCIKRVKKPRKPDDKDQCCTKTRFPFF